MKRLQIKLTPELSDVLAAMADADPSFKIGPHIETLLRADPAVEKMRKKLRMQWSDRRKIGKPQKISSPNV